MKERAEYRIRKVANGFMLFPGEGVAYDESEIFVFIAVHEMCDHIHRLWVKNSESPIGSINHD